MRRVLVTSVVRIAAVLAVALAAAAPAAAATSPTDVGAPTVTVISGPPAVSGGGLTRIEFTSTGADSVTCTMDGAALPDPCTSPLWLTDVQVGHHEVDIVATGPGGTATATVTWTVVPYPPASITIISAPPDSTSTTALVRYVAYDWVSGTCTLDSSTAVPCTLSDRISVSPD